MIMDIQTTYEELGQKINKENKAHTMAQLVKYRNHIDEDGDLSAPILLALDNLQSAVVLLTSIMKAEGADTGEIINWVIDRTMRSTVRHLEHILKVNIEADVLSAQAGSPAAEALKRGAAEAAEAREHNKSVVAEIMAGIMDADKGAKH